MGIVIASKARQSSSDGGTGLPRFRKAEVYPERLQGSPRARNDVYKSAMIIFLRIMAITILLAGSSHLLLGVGAEVLLGAKLSAETLAEPSLNSQNRFYGTSYMLYGILLWVCTRDMDRYALIFRILLLMTFAAGFTRIISVMLHGWPAPTIIALAVSELLLPPFIFWWQQRSRPLS